MKKPAVRSRWGSVSSDRRQPHQRLGGARRAAAGQIVEGEVGVGVQEGGDQALILSRGDRARRVDKHASRTEGAGAGGEDPRLRAGHLRDRLRASRASAGRGAPAACRAPSRAGRRARGRRPPARVARAARVGDLDADVAPRAAARAVRASAAGAARVALDRDDLAASRPSARRGACSCRPGPRTGRARARRARVRARARRASRRATARGTRPRATAASRARRTAPRARAPRGSRGRSACARAARGERGRVGDERVRAQRDLAGLVVAGHQRARVLGAERSATTAARSTPGGSA